MIRKIGFVTNTRRLWLGFWSLWFIHSAFLSLSGPSFFNSLFKLVEFAVLNFLRLKTGRRDFADTVWKVWTHRLDVHLQRIWHESPKVVWWIHNEPPNGVHAFCGCAIIQIFHPVDKIPHTRMSYHHLSHREYHMLVEIITQCRNTKMPQECNNCCHKTVASSFTRIQAWNIKSNG